MTPHWLKQIKWDRGKLVYESNSTQKKGLRKEDMVKVPMGLGAEHKHLWKDDSSILFAKKKSKDVF